MKKITLSKITTGKKKSEAQAPSRITNDTVAEHREQILAGGRRFKYPVQYARHKLVANAIIIGLVSLILLAGLGFQQLYFAQNSSDFMYRATQLAPVPVATVANEPVLYSDYLIHYRGSEHYLRKYDEVKMDSEDGRRQIEGIKRYALNTAETNAYAAKIAREKSLTITEKEVDDEVLAKRDTANGQISQETYDASTRMLYGWAQSDYRQAIKMSLLRAKVAFAVDDKAKAKADQASALIAEGKDLAAVATELGNGVAVQSPGLIDTTSSFNGLSISQVAKLEQGNISGALKSTTDNGYYFVRVVQKTDTQVNFEFIHIPLTQFNEDFALIKKNGQIHEFIKVAEQ